jgi:hypothetical protein
MKKGGASKRAKPVKDPYADYIRKFKEIRKPKGAKRLGKMGGGMMKQPGKKSGPPSFKKGMKRGVAGMKKGVRKLPEGLKKFLEKKKGKK